MSRSFGMLAIAFCIYKRHLLLLSCCMKYIYIYIYIYMLSLYIYFSKQPAERLEQGTKHITLL
jgi:hypothetical protein